MDDRCNWPDDPGKFPVKCQKTPAQVDACDGRPVNGHDRPHGRVLIFFFLARNIIAADGRPVVEPEECFVAAESDRCHHDKEDTEGNKD